MRKLAVLLALCLSFFGKADAQSPVGAWKYISGEVTGILLITHTWFTVTEYKANEFLSSYGGTWKSDNDKETSITILYNTEDKSQVGRSSVVPTSIQNDHLVTSSRGGGQQEWTRIDDGNGTLAGNWRISSREQNGKMNPMPLAARRTLKILTGTRFQWVAINIETGEFFGTGGGTYTFENGTYTEKIEFFSRDNMRSGVKRSNAGCL